MAGVDYFGQSVNTAARVEALATGVSSRDRARAGGRASVIVVAGFFNRSHRLNRNVKSSARA
jgi:class 3 adenylate cyclase